MRSTNIAVRIEHTETPVQPETRGQQSLGLRMAAYGLSRREQEIVAQAIQGLSNRQIADRLFICEQTVKDHLYTVFTKLAIHRRSQLAARLGGLPVEPLPPTIPTFVG